MVTNMYYKECEVMIGEVKTWVNLVKLGKMEYNVILGIDWLSTHRAHVDCHQKKKVTFKMEWVLEITFEGVRDEIMTQTISAVKAAKLLKRRCQGILATVLEKKETELKIEDIAVVNKYPNCVSERVTRLTSRQED